MNILENIFGIIFEFFGHILVVTVYTMLLLTLPIWIIPYAIYKFTRKRGGK